MRIAPCVVGLSLIVAGSAGCAAESAPSPQPDPNPTLPSGAVAAAPQATGTLSVQKTTTGVTGTFALGNDGVTFTTEVAAGKLDITVELHGMTLTGLIDRANSVVAYDGYASANGGDTQLDDADRALLSAFDRALTHAVQADATPTLQDLERSVSLWSETPSSVKLQRPVIAQANRSWTSICGQFETWQWATHDCWDYDNWAANSTSATYIGYHWDWSNTFYWVNSSWTTAEQDHKAYLYEAGDCFAHCGAGCPSGDQTLTVDCNNHDQCVRNGHDIASFWCDDEFTSASDDYTFAPSCSGTSWD